MNLIEKMTEIDYEKNVKEKLNKEGWVYVERDMEGRDIYCLNESTQLVLLNSIKTSQENRNKWYFIVYFDDYGVKECEKS